jgi:hypothetical protein
MKIVGCDLHTPGAPSFRVLCERVGGGDSIVDFVFSGYMSEVPTLAKSARVGHPLSWWSRRIRQERKRPGAPSFRVVCERVGIPECRHQGIYRTRGKEECQASAPRKMSTESQGAYWMNSD